MKCKFWLGVIIVGLLVLAGLSTSHADMNKDVAQATIQWQSNYTLVVQPIGSGPYNPNIRNNPQAPFYVQLYGVTDNYNAPTTSMAWYLQRFGNRPVHVKLIYVSSPNMGYVGAQISVNGVDLGRTLTKLGVLQANGLCHSQANNKAYCRELISNTKQ